MVYTQRHKYKYELQWLIRNRITLIQVTYTNNAWIFANEAYYRVGCYDKSTGKKSPKFLRILVPTKQSVEA